jgi:hypothetical protein
MRQPPGKSRMGVATTGNEMGLVGNGMRLEGRAG